MLQIEKVHRCRSLIRLEESNDCAESEPIDMQKQKNNYLSISSRLAQFIEFESKTEKYPFYFPSHYQIGAILLAPNG